MNMIKSTEVFGGFFNAMWLTAPSCPSLVGFIEEVLGDVHGVGLLGSHLTHDVVLDLVSHLSKSVLGGMHVFLTSFFLGSSSFHDRALIFMSTFTIESMIDIFVIEHAFSNMGIEALAEGIGIAFGTWFSPLSEGIDQMSTVSDDVGLSTGDGVDHLLGSAVKVHGDLLGFLGLGFSLEPTAPLLGGISDFVPVEGGVDLSIVVACFLDIESSFFQFFSVFFFLAFIEGSLEFPFSLSPTTHWMSITSIPWSGFLFFSCFSSWWNILYPVDSLAISLHLFSLVFSIPIFLHGVVTWCWDPFFLLLVNGVLFIVFSVSGIALSFEFCVS